MPQLPRGSKPLLRRVGGKEHASEGDHADPPPTPPASNPTRSSGVRKKAVEESESDYGSPKSTDDESVVVKGPTSGSGFQHTRGWSSAGDAEEKKSNGFKHSRALNSPESTMSKRSAEESEAAGNESDPDQIFGSSQRSAVRWSPKKQKSAEYGNIHAAPAPRKSKYKPPMTYTKKAPIGSQTKHSQQSKSQKQPAEPREPSPAFKLPQGGNLFASKGNDSAFKPARGENLNPRSPSISSLSSVDSDIEEIDATQLGLPDAEPYTPKANCGICNTRVPLLMRQAFEDKYPKAKGGQYKYQKWFCNFHKVAEAQAVWEERGYPEIEWLKLDRRLKRHHKHLVNVLEGNTPSFYREQLQKQVDAGGGKSALGALATSRGDDSDQSLNFTPGYYGPRGEKVVMEHVSSHFSDRLRELATSDPLIAAFGVKGGVSGFAQGVLVPELVVSLVMEDLKVKQTRAREVLRESKEMGELLSDEVGEKVSSIEIDD